MRIIETQRLFIDEATTEDTPFFFRLLNMPGWLMHIGDRNIKSEKDAENYITGRLINSYTTNGFGLYVMKLKETGESIGICGFIKRDYLPHADIGYASLPEYEGKGYMLEAAQSLMEYGFDKLSFTEVLAITTLTNNKSQQLLRRLGFENAGIIQPDKNLPQEQLFSKKKNS